MIYHGIAVLVLMPAISCKHPQLVLSGDPVRNLGPNDSIRINFKSVGNTALLIKDLPGDATGVLKRQEITLVNTDLPEDRNFEKITVDRLADGYIAKTILPAGANIHGDTLVAKDEKNESSWGDHFVIGELWNRSKRPIVIMHSGKTLALGNDTLHTSAWAGLPVKGQWEIRSMKTPAEIADSSRQPKDLRVFFTIKHR